ncbi:MAG: peptidase [Gammaproteobacteria bacterium]|nr:peptidase [Gammaproteobacteria bacterium]RPG23828.1 MAG: peptidase [Gammaproteobacteria bacterium TMED50]
MTYCVAAVLGEGVCFVSDSRTNAGVDNVSSYSKMHTFGQPGNGQVIILSAGNLATTQSVMEILEKDIQQMATINLLNAPTLADAADYVGQISLTQQEKTTGGGVDYEASFIVGGQLPGQEPVAYLVYPQGNHITSSRDTPYLQIGETKYGKPILDRIVTLESSLETSALCCLVSMDSTMRSNLSVAPPIDVLVYERDSFSTERRYRFDEHSEYLRQLKLQWDVELKKAFSALPPIAWSSNWDKGSENKLR